MKLIVLKCPTCGAFVDVQEGSKKAVCAFCDTPFYVDEDEDQVKKDTAAETAFQEDQKDRQGQEQPAGEKSQSYVDAAFEQSRRDNEEKAYQKRQKRWYTSLIIFAIVLLMALGSKSSGFFAAVLIFGGIGILSTRPGRSSRMSRSHDRTREEVYSEVYSDKNQLVALLLCFFLGIFGAHYFYVGKIGKGIIFLLTFGFFGIGWLIDVIRIACGVFRDKDGYYLKGWK